MPSSPKRRRIIQSDDEDEEEETSTRTVQSTKAANESAAADSAKEQSEEIDEELEAWHVFAEQYHDSVEQLPLEVHRNFRLLRQLEDEMQESTRKWHAAVREYVALVNPEPPRPTHPDDLETLPARTDQPREAAPHDEREHAPPEAASLVAPADGEEIPRPMSPRVSPRSERLDLPGQRPHHEPAGQHDDSLRSLMDIDAPSQDATDAAPKDAPKGEVTPLMLGAPTPSAEKTQLLRQVKQEMARLAAATSKLGEEKVSLAITVYQNVDRHIQRLDRDLLTFDDSLLATLRAKADARRAEAAPANALPQTVPAIRLTRHREQLLEAGKEIVLGSIKKKAVSAQDPNLRDMPVDPNEPTYCYCDTVSYGEMVGCDNDDCQREWFHLACVGLSEAPTGSWYCDDCIKALGIQPKVKRKKQQR
ncbi:uncharacterized protein L969DRAFT_83899 [Mixia osmundae IAM 14324]|uniref:Chromatin modification-related protein n=1 Tax=Mixia osmundae (strain CBS 9802 / IAM 14324 / JCM 22182 / KY 12970) TaxID=764103 RepID=G7DVC7_MIXOS|nr:uncharacterized protein L969DRAFT_83899 [Mixia osmundae IAM 14324]KEI42042.1 hypothetical protein L969DRAFT_83899 [Mixia osmundae IAM 14324]GAA94537.1 hypothetical protein E5Q_01189 [Mixia osmundae IAM 14324]